MADRPHLLILGGTGEAVELASRVVEQCLVTYSLAGRTRTPRVPGDVTLRCGGFGGSRALTAWIQEADVSAVIDATHPFAANIARNATSAARAAGVPHLKLMRPVWTEKPGDRWLQASSLAAAPSLLPSECRNVFLSVGQQELVLFSGVADVRFLIRTVDPLDHCPLERAIRITGRGPFRVDEEVALMVRYQIDAVVSRNSGGISTYAKIAAARTLGLPVVMIARPRVPACHRVDTVDAAMSWLDQILGPVT